MLDRFIIMASVLLALTAGEPAAAQSPNAGIGSARLLVGGPDPANPGLAWLGVHIRLKAGWHTYWRSAGDAGSPPEFDWTGSSNVVGADVEWPAPRRITLAGIDTFGYDDEVLFPVKVRLGDPQSPGRVSLQLTLYVCSAICTRDEVALAAVVSPGAPPTADADLIKQWHGKVPGKNSPRLSITSLGLSREPTPRLRIEVKAAIPLLAPDVFIDGDDAIVAGRPQFTTTGEGTSIATLPLSGADASRPGLPLRITLVDGERAVEAELPPSRADAGGFDLTGSPRAEQLGTGVLTALVIALLGGFILNFMPCVFPVLSLKLVSLLDAGHGKREIRAALATSAAGIVASFIALAASLAVFKAAGAHVGWGIQFQQPAFLIGMAAILVAFAANLLGLFDVLLPTRLGAAFGSIGIGRNLPSQFLAGFLMTLLATPCSAPFVGTAVAFALSQGTGQIFAIFAALGLGMAFPYLALAAMPGFGRMFPRPGRWMEKLRSLAAVALAATAVWLLTILAAVSGPTAAVSVGTGLGLLLWFLAVYRRRFAHAIAASLIVGLAGIAIATAGRIAPAANGASDGVRWRPFAAGDIPELVRNGRTVFVDVGAAWCITCKVNERVIIDSEAIRHRLDADVVPLQADWTRPDDAIARYLNAFGRYGLPFNAVFGPGAPDGIVLPELLTQDAVLAAFETASKAPSH